MTLRVRCCLSHGILVVLGWGGHHPTCWCAPRGSPPRQILADRLEGSDPAVWYVLRPGGPPLAHLLFSSKRLPAFEVLRSPSDRRVAEYVVLKNGLRVLLVSDPTRAGALGVFLFGTAFGCAAFGVVSRLQADRFGHLLPSNAAKCWLRFNLHPSLLSPMCVNDQTTPIMGRAWPPFRGVATPAKLLLSRATSRSDPPPSPHPRPASSATRRGPRWTWRRAPWTTQRTTPRPVVCPPLHCMQRHSWFSVYGGCVHRGSGLHVLGICALDASHRQEAT